MAHAVCWLGSWKGVFQGSSLLFAFYQEPIICTEDAHVRINYGSSLMRLVLITLRSFWENIATRLDEWPPYTLSKTRSKSKLLVRYEKTFKGRQNTRIWIQVSRKGANEHSKEKRRKTKTPPSTFLLLFSWIEISRLSQPNHLCLLVKIDLHLAKDRNSFWAIYGYIGGFQALQLLQRITQLLHYFVITLH